MNAQTHLMINAQHQIIIKPDATKPPHEGVERRHVLPRNRQQQWRSSAVLALFHQRYCKIGVQCAPSEKNRQAF